MSDFPLLPHGVTRGDLLLINADFSRNLLGQESEAVGQLGLVRLATYLATQGYTPAILETGGRGAGTTGPAELAAELARLVGSFRVLGLHLTSWNISSTTQALAQLPRDLPLLLGGPLASGAPRQVLAHFTALGFTRIGLVAGYGEQLCAAALATSDWDTIPGLHTPLSVGQLQRPAASEIATWPLLDPRYSAFVQQIYQPALAAGELGDRPMGMVFQAFGLDVNHGCPFDCSYCSLPAFGRSVACYTPSRVAAELLHLGTETGLFLFSFTNSNLLFIERDWILELCHEFQKLGIDRWASWTGYHHPLTIDLLSTDDLRLLAECGCAEIVVGVQSIDPAVAQIFHRPAHSFDLIRRIQTRVVAAGQRLVVDYITGVPGESLEKIVEFYDWCIEQGVECRSFQLKIYPGTALARSARSWSGVDLVPVTGELAPELESYAVVPRARLPDWFVAAEQRLREHNAALTVSRPVRLGQREIHSAQEAEKLLAELPWQSAIPAKVRQAQSLLLQGMLAQPASGRSSGAGEPAADELIRAVVCAGSDAPPILRSMQQRFRAEIGEQEWAALQRKFSGK